MCGRYTVIASPETLAERFDLPGQLGFGERYNIAPSQEAVVVVAGGERSREGRLMRWGLVPNWANDPAIGNPMINARAESAADKPAFRAAFRRRRCLVPADGFYEWRKSRSGKMPYRVRLKGGGFFAFAGLWETWSAPDGSPLETFTILTTQPNDLIRPIHDRMPVMLRPESESAWIDPAVTKADTLLPLLGPYPDEEMEAHAVSRHVNKPGHDDPRCVEPVEDGGLF